MLKFVVFFLLVVAALALPQSRSPESAAQIVKSAQDVGLDGYAFNYETENGIQASESGQIQPISAEESKKTVQGSFSFHTPEGTPITLNYVVDENGFQPSGAHLPTPPPIPEAILKSIEYNLAHPEPEEQAQPHAQAQYRRY